MWLRDAIACGSLSHCQTQTSAVKVNGLHILLFTSNPPTFESGGGVIPLAGELVAEAGEGGDGDAEHEHALLHLGGGVVVVSVALGKALKKAVNPPSANVYALRTLSLPSFPPVSPFVSF